MNGEQAKDKLPTRFHNIKVSAEVRHRKTGRTQAIVWKDNRFVVIPAAGVAVDDEVLHVTTGR